jgi:hypothetical protein
LGPERLFQEREKGEEVSEPRRVEPSWNSTLETPTLSEAEAERVRVPETVEPEVGAVRDTVGAVRSLSTVTVTEAEVAERPEASKATAERE